MKCFRVKGSAILTTIFLLFGILTVALIGLEIIMSGLASRRAQGSSAKAFWAAETGIERATMAFKSFNTNDALFVDCSNGEYYLKFCDEADNKCENIDSNVACVNFDDKPIYFLNNSETMPSYWVKVKTDGRNVALTSQGSFLATSRQIYVKFCLPTCFGKATGDDDGCGGTCK